MPVKKKIIIKNKNVNKNNIKININTKKKSSVPRKKKSSSAQPQPAVNVYSNISIPPFYSTQTPISNPTHTPVDVPVKIPVRENVPVRETNPVITEPPPIFVNQNQPIPVGLDHAPPAGNLPPIRDPTPVPVNTPEPFRTPVPAVEARRPDLTIIRKNGKILNPRTNNYIQDTKKNREMIIGYTNS